MWADVKSMNTFSLSEKHRVFIPFAQDTIWTGQKYPLNYWTWSSVLLVCLKPGFPPTSASAAAKGYFKDSGKCEKEMKLPVLQLLP